MTEINIFAEYEQLKKEVRYHADLYYQKDSPVISDFEYDQLFKKLKTMEESHSFLNKEDSPTQKILLKNSSTLEKIQHLQPMLSIDNAMNSSETLNFLERLSKELNISTEELEFFAEPKYDGLSCSLIYSNGYLISAATRGDGYFGEDVTKQVKTISNIPQVIPNLGKRIEIRGEILMPKEDFDNLNNYQKSIGEKCFVNPRNAAAGSLRHLDPEVTKSRNLKFFAYAFGACSEFAIPEFQSDVIHELKFTFKFEVSDTVKKVIGFNAIENFYKIILEKRPNLQFEIDGVVFKLDSKKLQDTLGWNNRVPKWAIAYKFPPEEINTIVENIEVQIGRTGILTPVARLKPVFVGGVTVSNATLHNQEEIIRLGVNIGDIVTIRRAGDVIPEIVRVAVKNSNDSFKLPDTCPVCSSKVIKDTQKVGYRCIGGMSCKSQKLFSISHFCSRLAMNIDGLGEAVIEKLLNANLITTASDLTLLTFEQLSNLEGLGKKSASNILTQISNAKYPSLNKFIYSLGIPNVGENTSKQLANNFKTFEKLKAASKEDLIAISDIGPITAESITSFFFNTSNCFEVSKLVEYFNPKDVLTVEAAGNLLNLSFVITGTLSLPRETYKALIENNGGKVSDSITKKTKYLLAGDNAGSKLDKAKQLNVKILSENDFNTLIKEHSS